MLFVIYSRPRQVSLRPHPIRPAAQFGSSGEPLVRLSFCRRDELYASASVRSRDHRRQASTCIRETGD